MRVPEDRARWLYRIVAWNHYRQTGVELDTWRDLSDKERA